MHCMAAMPHKLFSGFCYGYDPQTGILAQLHDDVEIPHLAALMGGPELMLELAPLLDDPAWNEAWLHYCRYLQAPPEEQIAALGAAYHSGRGPHFARMTGYAAAHTQDPALARRAWNEFFRPGKDGILRPKFAATTITGPDVPTPPGIRAARFDQRHRPVVPERDRTAGTGRKRYSAKFVDEVLRKGSPGSKTIRRRRGQLLILICEKIWEWRKKRRSVS